MLISTVQHTASVIQICTFPFQNLFHHGLSQDMAYGSLRCPVGPWGLFILPAVVCIYLLVLSESHQPPFRAPRPLWVTLRAVLREVTWWWQSRDGDADAADIAGMRAERLGGCQWCSRKEGTPRHESHQVRIGRDPGYGGSGDAGENRG